MTERYRILYGNVGNALNIHASSGSAYPFYQALGKRFDMAGSLDASFNKFEKVFNAIMSFDLNSTRWRERRHKSIGTFLRHSQVAKKRSAEFFGKYDFYLQERALFNPFVFCKKPYAIHTDCTHQITLDNWPEWSPFNNKELSDWLREEKKIYDNASLLLPRSKYVADSMINDYGQPKEKVHVVGSGVNFTETPPAHKGYDCKTLLFIGYDFKRKGGYQLLNAFKLASKDIKELRLIIVGPKSLNVELPAGVSLLGKIHDRSVIAKLYQEASLFVMPSIFEPWGNVYYEALAHGVPCVGCNSGATPEVILDGLEGMLVPQNNSDALAAAIVQILSNPDKLSEMGTYGRNRVISECSWDKTVAHMAAHIERVCRSNE